MAKNKYFEKFNGKSNQELNFMETCEKADIKSLLGQKVYIDAYGIVNGQDGEYAIIHVTSTPDKFYFGGKVVTDKLARFDKDGMHDALKDEQVEFVKKTAKSGRDYIDLEIG